MFDQAWHPCDLCNLERWSEGGPGLASSYSRQSRQPSPSMYHDDDNENDNNYDWRLQEQPSVTIIIGMKII